MIRAKLTCAAVLCAMPAIACDVDFERMIDQPRYETYERCEICPDDTIMLELPENTVSRAEAILPPRVEAGFDAQGWVRDVPIEIDETVLARGQGRFDIYCAACHGKLGNGITQVAENMRLREPPNLLIPPISDYPPGRIYRAVNQGFGLMPTYAEELNVVDRWAVVAYVQALQLSQGIELEALPPRVREEAQTWLK